MDDACIYREALKVFRKYDRLGAFGCMKVDDACADDPRIMEFLFYALATQLCLGVSVLFSSLAVHHYLVEVHGQGRSRRAWGSDRLLVMLAALIEWERNIVYREVTEHGEG